MPLITVSPGPKNNPRGERARFFGVHGLVERIKSVPAQKESWWSPHIWGDDYRDGEKWKSASCVVLDCDYMVKVEGQKDKHTFVPEELQRTIIENPPPCGNIYHLTPRGLRIVFVLNDVCGIKGIFKKYVDGAKELFQKWNIETPDGSFFEIDRASYDYARFMYGPFSVVDGIHRENEVIVLRDDFYRQKELCESCEAFDELPLAQTLTPSPSESDGFQKLLREYNLAHTRDWGKPGAKKCPTKHPGDQCFGALPADPSRWVCWSTHHPEGCGRPFKDGQGYSGDAADLDAYLSGQTVVELVTGNSHPLTNEDAERMLEEWRNLSEGERAKQNPRFTIKKGEMHLACDFAERVLSDRIFVRGDRLCIVRDGAISFLRKEYIQNAIGRSIDWFKYDSKMHVIRTDPPADLVSMLFGKGEYEHFCPLNGVSSLPMFSSSGAFISKNGYDRETGYFFAIPEGFGSLPVKSTKEDAIAARDHLFDLVSDFPFKSDIDKSAMFAPLLTYICRNLYKGNTPLFVFDSTTPRSGKSRLARLAAHICLDGDISSGSLGKTQDEIRKEIFTVVDKAPAFHVFDNVTGTIRSDALEAVLTSGGMYSGRRLGTPDQVILPVNTVFSLSANNAQLGGDLFGRVLLCQLNPDSPNPELRNNFKISDFDAHVQNHKNEYYISACRMVQAWLQAGRPSLQKKTWGSFENWSIIRDILLFCEMTDPFERTTSDIKEESLEVEDHGQLLLALRAIYLDEVFSGRDVAEQLPESVVKDETLYSVEVARWKTLKAVLGEMGFIKNGFVDTRGFGFYLRSILGRHHSCGFVLKVSSLKTGNRRHWQVCASGEKAKI